MVLSELLRFIGLVLFGRCCCSTVYAFCGEHPFLTCMPFLHEEVWWLKDAFLLIVIVLSLIHI